MQNLLGIVGKGQHTKSAFIIAAVCVLTICSSFAVDISFVAGDYDNTANTVNAGPTPVNHQTTGNFRDVIWWSLNNGLPRVGSDDFINAGNSLILSNNSAVPGSGPYTSLNFTGPSVAGGQSYISIYDTTPADSTVTRNLFDASQTLVLSADVLFVKHSVSGGVVALYNEGQNGLALLASNGDGNNPDIPKLSLVSQSAGMGTTLDSVSLGFTSFVPGNWYRVTMNLTVSGSSWIMNGSFQNHVNPTDPTSALGGTITTLSDTGSVSSQGLTNPGEVGLMAMANEGIALPDNVGVSITDFHVANVPEPSSMTLLGFGLVALCCRKRRQS